MTVLCAFHGLPRAGKSTGAHALVERGFARIGFADGLYREVARTFGVTEAELHSHEWKTVPQPRLVSQYAESMLYRAMLDSTGEDMKAPRTSRYHLQRWATEFRRKADPHYWIKQLAATATTLRNCPIVIDDLRFFDEYSFLVHFSSSTNRVFKVIEIIRPGVSEYSAHISDMRLPGHCIDRTIANNSSTDDLRQTVVQLLGIQ